MAELTLVGLRVVQEVAARGSFTGAADALGYTQSAVSRQVAAMESAAGAPLFERLPRGVRPTAAGQVLLRHAGPLLDRAEAARLELGGLSAALEERVAVGAFPTAIATIVPGALARLCAEHPGVAVTLREGTSPAQLRRLRGGRLDVAVVGMIASATAELDDLRADVLMEGGLMVAVAPGHRLAHGAPVSLADLAGEPWIAGDVRAGDFGFWPGLESARVDYVVRDWAGRLGLVAAGLGVTVVPSMLRAAEPAGVVLVEVDDQRPVARRSLLAVTRDERSPGVAALINALRAEAS
jgi:DNA-binding transcriptional LysR family regulator